MLEPPRSHLAISVLVSFVRFDEVRVGSLCLNHPELVHKHPTHLAISVMVWFV